MTAIASSSKHKLDDPVATADGNGADDFALPADYKPYVPVAKRRAQLLARAKDGLAKRARVVETSDDPAAGGGTSGGEKKVLTQEEVDDQAREKARRETTLLKTAREVKERKEQADKDKTKADLEAEKDAMLLVEMERAQKKLAGVKEIAEGTVWTENIKTSWTAPRWIREMTELDLGAVRETRHILVEGDNVPPVIEKFAVSCRAGSWAYSDRI
jgi:ATP-dependent RNA helicase DDX41